MEDQVNKLVEKTWSEFQKKPQSERLLISISGIPGSGKTKLAATVASRVNALHAASQTETTASPIAAFIPMDGYHLTRAQLSAMPDPVHAHARRGAAFTFDGLAFLGLVQKIREPLTPESKTLYAPSFDHAVKDPVQDDIPIPPTARVLIFEGNYLSLNKSPWDTVAKLMDELWFIDVDFETARKRLVRRHVEAGIAANEEEANKRVTENDWVNGQEIVDGKLGIHETVVSREDDSWKPEAQTAIQ